MVDSRIGGGLTAVLVASGVVGEELPRTLNYYSQLFASSPSFPPFGVCIIIIKLFIYYNNVYIVDSALVCFSWVQELSSKRCPLFS